MRGGKASRMRVWFVMFFDLYLENGTPRRSKLLFRDVEDAFFSAFGIVICLISSSPRVLNSENDQIGLINHPLIAV